MACDILNELAALGCLPQHYYILEVSADLRERQGVALRQRAPQYAERVRWLEHLPEDFRGVVLANEVLGALPVQRFRIRGGQVNTLGVTWQLGRLDWSEARADEGLESAVRHIEAYLGECFQESYTSEINLRLLASCPRFRIDLRPTVNHQSNTDEHYPAEECGPRERP